MYITTDPIVGRLRKERYFCPGLIYKWHSSQWCNAGHPLICLWRFHTHSKLVLVPTITRPCELYARSVDKYLLFHNDFSLAVNCLNNMNKLKHYNNHLTAVEHYFTNIAAVQNMGVLYQMWLYEIHGDILLICQNTTMQVYGAWIKIYCVLCSKTYSK